MTHVRRRGYLTFVITAVPKLRIFDFQCPVVRLRVVDRPESLVVRVRVTADGEQMDVPVPDPGNLQRHRLVPQVLHAAIQVRSFAQDGGHVLRIRHVEVRTVLRTAVIQAVLMNVVILSAASMQHAVAVRPVINRGESDGAEQPCSHADGGHLRFPRCKFHLT